MRRAWDDMLHPNGQAYHPPLRDWKERQNRVVTRLGGLTAGYRSEMLLRGYRMIGEMTGKISFIQGWVLSITGRLPDKREDRLLNAMFINTALTDPRFWPFRTARLGATVKSSPAACMAAGILTNEADFFSSGAAYDTSVFFRETLRRISRKQATVEAAVQEKLDRGEKIGGFGRVLARGTDERNPSLLKVARECGLDKGRHLKLALSLEKALHTLKSADIHMNSGGLKCALLLDSGFTPLHISIFYTLMLAIGIAGNVAEAYEEAPGAFMPLSCDDIEYTGPPPRAIPAAPRQTVIQGMKGKRKVSVDSVSHLDRSNRGDIVVCGSHGGVPAAEHCLSFHLRGIVFNDAGKGKDDAGILGLELLEAHGIPAAAADARTARIGDGMDAYRNGIVSSVNASAYRKGLRIGMPVRKALVKMR